MKYIYRTSIFFLATLICVAFSAPVYGAAGKPKYPTKLSAEIKQSFREADDLYHSGSFTAADQAFARFIEEFEYNELTDEAKFKRGEIRFNEKRYNEALNFYRSAGDGIYNPNITPKVQLKGGLALYHLKRYGEAIDIVSGIRRQDTSPMIRVRADSVGMLSARNLGWPGKRTVRFALFLVDDYIDLGGNDQPLAGLGEIVSENEAQNFVRNWIEDTNVTQEDMDILPLESYMKKPSGGYVLYKEALVAQRHGDLKKANSLFKKFTHSYPKNEYYSKAKIFLAETSARTGDAHFKVGVILPLSGRYHIYGESVLQGIECALGLYPPCEGPQGIQLVIKDSRGSAAVASKAVDELAEEDVQAIIGPLLSATVFPAATRAQQLGIPMITVSQKSGSARIGEFIFRNSVTARSQVDSLVDYAARKRGLKRYFIFYPVNKKGNEFKDLFSESVRSAGGRVVAAKGYNPRAQDLAGQVREIRFQGDRIDLTAPTQANYDAIFLPGSAWSIAYVAPMLSMMGMEKVQLLGTMRWNDPNLIKRGGKYLDGAVFVQALDKRGNDPNVRSFVDRFKVAYNREPTLLEGLGYDSMKLILKSSSQGAHKRSTIREILIGLTDFQGVTGRISFDEYGDAQRKLKVMRIQNGQATAVD